MVTHQNRDMGSGLLHSKYVIFHWSMLLHLRHGLDLGSFLLMYLIKDNLISCFVLLHLFNIFPGVSVCDPL